MTRYASGEEPRVGDFVRFDDGHSERSVQDVLSCGSVVVMSNGEHWPTAGLRLIDRPRELSSTALVAQRPELVTPAPERCRLDDTCDLPRNHGPACRVLLGHDRHGREVRRGDRLRVFDRPEFVIEAGSLQPEDPLYEACFHSIDGSGHILQMAAELVTDEKPRWLGNDRHEHNVLMGDVLLDIVNGWRGTVIGGHCGPTDQRSFECERHTRGGRDKPGRFWVMSWNTELVTDEKADPATQPHGFREGDRVRVKHRGPGTVTRDIGDTGMVAINLDCEEFYPRRFAVGNVEPLVGKPALPEPTDYIFKQGDSSHAPCPAQYAGVPCDRELCHDGLHGFNDRHAPNGRMEWALEGEPALEQWKRAAAVQEFARWLAAPTTAERFEVFKQKVAAAIHKFSVFDVEAWTDRTAEGLLLRLRVGASHCEMHCKDDVAWTMVENFIAIAVASESDRIGREALKVRKAGT
jgi:hypothetical protein